MCQKKIRDSFQLKISPVLLVDQWFRNHNVMLASYFCSRYYCF